jgi:hypothetical protein
MTKQIIEDGQTIQCQTNNRAGTDNTMAKQIIEEIQTIQWRKQIIEEGLTIQ